MNIYIYIYCSIVHRPCFAVLSSSTNRDPREIIEDIDYLYFVWNFLLDDRLKVTIIINYCESS